MQVRKRNEAAQTTNSFNFFDRGWNDYKNGFGDIESDYWIGLETLYNASAQADWILRVYSLVINFLFLFYIHELVPRMIFQFKKIYLIERSQSKIGMRRNTLRTILRSMLIRRKQAIDLHFLDTITLGHPLLMVLQ